MIGLMEPSEKQKLRGGLSILIRKRGQVVSWVVKKQKDLYYNLVAFLQSMFNGLGASRAQIG